MYRDFFCLQEKPFQDVADPAFFFAADIHMRALMTVCQGIRERCGLVLLLGETGTGKTTICQRIRSLGSCRTVYINNPYLTELDFLESINRDLGIGEGKPSTKSLMDALYSYLISQSQTRNLVILIMDEAHRFSASLLELVLALANMQRSDGQLLQIVLVADPEMVDVLGQPRLASLNQRIAVRFQLQGFAREDTYRYVSHRLHRAGCKSDSLFSKRALEAIWKASGGLPRVINQLCERALVQACRNGKKQVGKREACLVGQDPLYRPMLCLRRKIWRPQPALSYLSLALALCAGVVLGLNYPGGRGSKPLMGTAPELEKVRIERQTFVRRPISQANLALGPRYEGIEPSLLASGNRVAPRGYLISQPGAGESLLLSAATPRSQPRIVSEAAENQPGTGQEAAEVKLSKIKVSAIAWDAEAARRVVVLNDQVLHEGDFFGKARVLRIHPDYVVLLCGNEHFIKKINAGKGGQ